MNPEVYQVLLRAAAAKDPNAELSDPLIFTWCDGRRATIEETLREPFEPVDTFSAAEDSDLIHRY